MMATSKLSALDHLRLVALRGKADSNERIAELADAIYAVIEELDAEKAEAAHTHTPVSVGGIPTVAVTGDGATYTATVDGVTALVAGLTLTIVPDTTSTTVLPKLNINGLGAKSIKQKNTMNTSATLSAKNSNWLVKNKPLTIQYDGLQWSTLFGRATAADIYGFMAVENGGTGADNAVEALANLLPTGGTEGQVLTMGADGVACWADSTGGAAIPSAEGVEF